MSSEPLIWLDGRPATALPLPDRGLDFGDGLFETLLLRDGAPLHTDFHLQRLRRGIDLCYFPDCLSQLVRQMALVSDAVLRSGWPWAVLRVTLTRGQGPRGYAPPVDASPRIVLVVTPLQRDPKQQLPPARLGLATMRWGTQPQLAGIKHLNRLEQVLAARETAELGLDEMVMMGQAGHVISVTAGNIFARSGDLLVTPSLDHCGVAGTRRALLREVWAPRLGLQLHECELGLERLAQADEVFYSNSLLGLRSVQSFGDKQFQNFSLCRQLFDCYLEGLA